MRPRCSRRGAAGAAALGLAAAWLAGCSDTRLDPMSCHSHPCAPGRVCDRASNRCVLAPDGGPGEAGAPPSGFDAPPARLDAPAMDGPSSEAHADVPGAGTLDGALDVPLGSPDVPAVIALDGPASAPLDVALDGSPTGAIDTRVPDAAGSCALDQDCGAAAPYCLAGRCVACRTSSECGGGAPICSTSHTCVSCALADGGCPANAPACEADSGRCVACVDNGGCSVPTRPICDPASFTCVPCARDEECAGVGPGICLAHLDGRCATDDEAIYVGPPDPATCSDTAASAGTRAVPYCTAERGVRAANAKGKALVVLAGALSGGFSGIALDAPLAVVGRNAVLNADDYADGIGITSGELYLRGITVAGSAARATGIGINAQATLGATLVLRLRDCTIRGNPGGGVLLAGAAFDIENSTVTGNGPGETAAGVTFGGIRIEGTPSAGPASIRRSTITDNLAPGLSCASAIQGTGVLATGNAVREIASSCALVSCGVPGPACGAE